MELTAHWIGELCNTLSLSSFPLHLFSRWTAPSGGLFWAIGQHRGPAGRHTKVRLQNARMKIQSLDLTASECDGPRSFTRSHPVPTCIASIHVAGRRMAGVWMAPMQAPRGKVELEVVARPARNDLARIRCSPLLLFLSTHDNELRTGPASQLSSYRCPCLGGLPPRRWLCSFTDPSSFLPSDPSGGQREQRVVPGPPM